MADSAPRRGTKRKLELTSSEKVFSSDGEEETDIWQYECCLGDFSKGDELQLPCGAVTKKRNCNQIPERHELFMTKCLRKIKKKPLHYFCFNCWHDIIWNCWCKDDNFKNYCLGCYWIEGDMRPFREVNSALATPASASSDSESSNSSVRVVSNPNKKGWRVGEMCDVVSDRQMWQLIFYQWDAHGEFVFYTEQQVSNGRDEFESEDTYQILLRKLEIEKEKKNVATTLNFDSIDASNDQLTGAERVERTEGEGDGGGSFGNSTEADGAEAKIEFEPHKPSRSAATPTLRL